MKVYLSRKLKETVDGWMWAEHWQRLRMRRIRAVYVGVFAGQRHPIRRPQPESSNPFLPKGGVGKKKKAMHEYGDDSQGR